MSFSHYDEDGARTSHRTHCCIGARRATHCATGDEHMGRMKEVINKIRKNTKLKFKYVPPPGVEDIIEMEVTQNEAQMESKQHTQTATKHLPTCARM